MISNPSLKFLSRWLCLSMEDKN